VTFHHQSYLNVWTATKIVVVGGNVAQTRRLVSFLFVWEADSVSQGGEFKGGVAGGLSGPHR